MPEDPTVVILDTLQFLLSGMDREEAEALRRRLAAVREDHEAAARNVLDAFA